MKNQILSALAVAGISAGLVFSQTTGTAPTPPTLEERVANQVARLTKLLDLTTDQQTRATAIFTTAQTALDALRTSMETAQTNLQTAVQANNAAAIPTAAAAIGTLTAQRVLAEATADAAVFQILTTDQ